VSPLHARIGGLPPSEADYDRVRLRPEDFLSMAEPAKPKGGAK